jgi:predicted Rossmann-fold nucleotide-binding protein
VRKFQFGYFDFDRAETTINSEDPDLLQILDKPQEVVDAIFNFYEGRGFEPSPEEQQILLDL